MKEIKGFQILLGLHSHNCFSSLTLDEIMQKLDFQNNQRNDIKMALDELVEEQKLLDYDKATGKYKINEEEFNKLEMKNL